MKKAIGWSVLNVILMVCIWVSIELMYNGFDFGGAFQSLTNPTFLIVAGLCAAVNTVHTFIHARKSAWQ